MIVLAGYVDISTQVCHVLEAIPEWLRMLMDMAVSTVEVEIIIPPIMVVQEGRGILPKKIGCIIYAPVNISRIFTLVVNFLDEFKN